ncbi:MAG: ABC transporter substrate-binding protein [Bacilli bacterium]
MNLKGIIKKLFLTSLLLFITISFASCKNGCKKEKDPEKELPTYDNETTPLVFSTQEVDKVFNPFFSTSATDSNVVGLTQIGMIGNDKEGNPTYGDNESVVTKDLAIVSTGTGESQTTTYYFVLKNNVRFSNGSYLTIKDVLFNLYVYLDPVYTGSSTIYSTDIVGLQEYRTQQETEEEQKSFNEKFEIIAESRVQALVDAAETVLDENKGSEMTSELFLEKLQEFADNNSGSDAYKNIIADYNQALKLFKEELQNDFNNSKDSYSDMKFKGQNGTIHENLFTTDVEVFLYNEGYITWNKKENDGNGKLVSSLTRDNEVATLKTWTEQQAIETIFLDKIPSQISEIISYWNTAITLNEYIVNQAKQEYYQNAGDKKYPNISGIQFANRLEPVTVNNVTYGVPTYNEDGSVKSGYEVLTITIKKVDPKAIWNFAFGVAPMYYYSDQEHIDKFDYVSNFGVEYSSPDFMDYVVKDDNKIGVPVGAGPYAASKSSGGITGIQAGNFYDAGVIYFERNPYYVMGPAKIKKIRYQVVSSNRMLDALYNGEIDFAEPNAKPETIDQLNDKADEGIGNKQITTSGYGYIGINAGKVPSIAVRQAIMHAINTKECVDYYKTTAKEIHRSMSLASWAYPEGATAYYPYIGGKVPENLNVVNPAYAEYIVKIGAKAGDVLSASQQEDFLRGLIEGAGYELNGDDIYQKGNDILKYTFTIAGEETDHPAWAALFHASEILNKIGFEINVTTDSNALKKLANGDLTVWAAAWGSTIDPDMYQVYHKDSKATSTLNWGYKQILQNAGGKYDIEYAIVEELSQKIDAARQTNDQKQRASIYREALNLVMELAVELPTYQRKDLFAYNTYKIDTTSLTPDSELSPYKGLTSELHNVSLVQER